MSNRLRACTRAPGALVPAAIAILVALAHAPGAEAVPRVFFAGEPYCAEHTGDRFTASIQVDASGDSISCFHLFLTYDRTRLVLVSATEGTLFANSGFPTFFIWENQSADTTAFGDCLLGAGTFVLGPGELVRLVFEVRPCGAPAELLLDFTPSRALPPPLQLAYLTNVRRMIIPGVDFADGRARICGSCSAAVEEEAGTPGAPRLRLSPNPAADFIRLDWSLPPAGGRRDPELTPTLTVFDPAGRSVLTRALDGSTAGSLVWHLAAAGGNRLHAGVYWVELRAGDRVFVSRFVVAR